MYKPEEKFNATHFIKLGNDQSAVSVLPDFVQKAINSNKKSGKFVTIEGRPVFIGGPGAGGGGTSGGFSGDAEFADIAPAAMRALPNGNVAVKNVIKRKSK